MKVARHASVGLIGLAGMACLLPSVNSAVALLAGVALALMYGNPFAARTKALTPKLLSYAIVGLGAGIDLAVVARAGFAGLSYTLCSIAGTLALGLLLARALKLERNTSLLITVGTAICGGSAIAAVFPLLRAKSHEVSVALGVVFLLNALALVLFPAVGHGLHLSQEQFGLWSALAIHDTSSVVGAGLQYGPRALEIGTTVKLARALWIVPLTLGIGYWQSRQASRQVSSSDTTAPAAAPKKPWFILGFLLASALVTWVPGLQPAGHVVEAVAKRLLVLTLFLIGLNLTRANLRAVGFKPLLHGVALWLTVAFVSLAVILRA